MSEAVESRSRRPRVCACVLMNHPFPRNLPLLRRLYETRFSAVRFLIPFERSADADVITVYRGSYVHAAYLTDAKAELEALDCDYYLIIHDDVLLSPRISEATFLDVFRLGPDDGFIPIVGPAPGDIGAWVWHYGLIAKLLFPKSILFGSGVERENLAKYLPPADALLSAIRRTGIEPAQSVRLDSAATAGLAGGTNPSRLLLHGLSEPLPAGTAQDDVDARSAAIEQDLIDAMLAAHHAAHPADGTTVPLPIPLVGSGYMTDFYVLPRSGLADFCHYVGIAGAANLFVEVIAPTLLFACCERVRTAADLGLDFSGFDAPKQPDWFLRDGAVAIHPFKLSALKTADQQDAFADIMDALGRSTMPEAGLYAAAGFRGSLDAITREGWLPAEAWGVWAGRAEGAMLEVPLDQATSLDLHLVAPLHATIPSLSGSLIIGGGTDTVLFTAAAPNGAIVVHVPLLRPDADGVARIALTTERLVVPSELGEDSPDTRGLGFGLVSARWAGHELAGAPAIPGTGR